MHLQRLITGLAALPLLIWLIFAGGGAFAGFIGVVALISMWEYYRIIYRGDNQIIWSPIALAGYLTALLAVGAAHLGEIGLVAGALAINFIGCGLLSAIQFKNDPKDVDVVAKQVFGSVYISLMLGLIVLLRNSPDGTAWIFFLLFLVFFGDIGAYYAGTYYGKNKLCPSVSPKKTVEGALGGLAASVAIGIVFKLVFLPDLPFVNCLLMFLCVGFVAPFGDLFESTLKRVGNIKDSGFILPGHGGLLDRVDALLFAVPVVYLFKTYIL